MSAPDRSGQTSPLPLLVFGLATVAVWLRVAHLSRQFIWGQERPDRPIWEFVILYLVAAAAYLGGYLWLRRQRPAWWYGPLIIAVALFARLILLPSNMIQESDAYRYLWDGHVQQAGINPYAHAPQYCRWVWDTGGDRASPDDLRRFIGTISTDNDAWTVLRRVSYPDVVTVYPPLAQQVFRLVTTAAPWSLGGLRVTFLAFDLAALAVVGWSLRRRPPARRWAGLLLYAWSPLVIKEIANSIHYDSLVALLLAMMAALLLARPRGLQGAALLAASACLGLAAGAKLYPLLLAPLLFVVQWRHGRGVAVGGLAVTLLVIALLYAPFMERGVNPTGALGQFVVEWERNALIHPLVTAGMQSLGVDRVAPWLPEAWRGHAPSVAASGALGVGLLLLIVGLCVRVARRGAAPRRFPDAAVIVLVAAFCIAPVQNPWYLVGAVPLVAIQRRPFVSVIALTGLLGIRYLSFYYEYLYHPRFDAPGFRRATWIVRGAQFIPFYLMAAVEGAWRMRRRRRLCRRIARA